MKSNLSTTIEFREATEFDVEKIQSLYKVLVNNPQVEVHQSRIQQIANDLNNFLFLMTIDNEIIGTCFITLCLDPMLGFQPYAVLENVVIESKYQGEGCGRAMFQFVEQFCLEKDCSKIMLLSSIARKEAHGFFNAVGYQSNKKLAFVKYSSNFAKKR